MAYHCKYYTCNTLGPLPQRFTLRRIQPMDSYLNSITCTPKPFGTLDSVICAFISFIHFKLMLYFLQKFSILTRFFFPLYRDWLKDLIASAKLYQTKYQILHGSCSTVTFSDYLERAAKNATTYSQQILDALVSISCTLFLILLSPSPKKIH